FAAAGTEAAVEALGGAAEPGTPFFSGDPLFSGGEPRPLAAPVPVLVPPVPRRTVPLLDDGACVLIMGVSSAVSMFGTRSDRRFNSNADYGTINSPTAPTQRLRTSRMSIGICCPAKIQSTIMFGECTIKQRLVKHGGWILSGLDRRAPRLLR